MRPIQIRQQSKMYLTLYRLKHTHQGEDTDVEMSVSEGWRQRQDVHAVSKQPENWKQAWNRQGTFGESIKTVCLMSVCHYQ